MRNFLSALFQFSGTCSLITPTLNTCFRKEPFEINWHRILTGRMPFLWPNKQCQSTEKNHTNISSRNNLSVCLSVCFSVPYARPQFWADLDQSAHDSHVAFLYPSDSNEPVREHWSCPQDHALQYTTLQMGAKLRRGICNRKMLAVVSC